MSIGRVCSNMFSYLRRRASDFLPRALGEE
jgi:hypothetical protein